MQPNADQPHDRNDPTSSHRRVTVPEAARILGISPEAVRARIQRGTLVKHKAPDGTVYVQLDVDRARSNGDREADGTHNGRRSNADATPVEGDLVDILQEHVSYLRDQLDQEREANKENRRIIAGLVQRVPELEAAQEPRDGSVTVSEGTDKGDVPREPQEPAQRRSWLYRFFFG